MTRQLLPLALLLSLTYSVAGQHATVKAIAANPADPSEIWACNRGNDSVSVIETGTATVTEVAVGVWPRSIAFTGDGATAFVANQRGNVAGDHATSCPRSQGDERRGTISVIDAADAAAS